MPLLLVMFVKIRYNTLYETRKEAAVLALCSRSVPAKSIADNIGVTRQALYLWKEQLLGKGASIPMKSTTIIPDVKLLKDKQDFLKKEVYTLRLEKEILEQAADLIKKDLASIQSY